MLLIADWNDPYVNEDVDDDITWEQEQEWEEIRLRERIAWEQAWEQEQEYEDQRFYSNLEEKDDS